MMDENPTRPVRNSKFPLQQEEIMLKNIGDMTYCDKLDFEDLLLDMKKLQNTEKIIELLFDTFLDFADFVQSQDEALYEKKYLELFGKLYKNHFNDSLANFAVSGIQSEDLENPNGEYWSMRKAVEIARKNGIKFDKWTEGDWYYTLNAMRSDFFSMKPSDNEDENEKFFCALAKNFIADKDAIDGKAYVYWLNIAKKS